MPKMIQSWFDCGQKISEVYKNGSEMCSQKRLKNASNVGAKIVKNGKKLKESVSQWVFQISPEILQKCIKMLKKVQN